MCIIENIQRKEIDGIYIQHVECAIKKNDHFVYSRTLLLGADFHRLKNANLYLNINGLR